MPLSNEDREKIREEELLRLQVAEEFRRSRQTNWWTEPRIIGAGAFGAALAMLLFTIMRTV